MGTTANPSAFFTNLCVSGNMLPLTQGELLHFFHVNFAPTNLVPDDMPEVRELLRRGQQFYQQDQNPQNDHVRKSSQERNNNIIPKAGIECIPDFLYLNPIEINGIPQVGLFTSKALPVGTWIGTYTGKLLSGNHPSRSLYTFLFEDRNANVTLQIDAQNHGNHIRFMNHSDRPNVKPEYIFHEGMYYIAMTTIREVGAHHQLAYNYSNQYWEKLGITPAVL